MKYTFKSPSCPSACGRTPVDGDELFTISFPTDEGGLIEVHMGRADFVYHAALLLKATREDPGLKADVNKGLKGIQKSGEV